MPGDSSPHPGPERLAAFSLGKLDEAETTAVVEHVESCEGCRRTVEETPSATFLDALQAARPDPEPALPPELATHPRFRILRELARGGMGVVYLAEHRLMEWLVAIKIIRKALVDNPEAVERFHREVRAARLDDKNIVRAYDAEQAGDLHLLVMEYVEGQSLAEVLQRRGPLPVALACDYLRQAARALQHAFERGMVHRDLKPHNLMVLPEQGLVKVLDFGLARLASERHQGRGQTAENVVLGTPEYMAPEQATDARQADIRADIYSLGCTLYCLLLGRPPFVEQTAMQTILAHLNKEAAPLHEERSDVPAELSAVVARMLAKDPAQRYQTPAEVAEALAPFCKPGETPTAAVTASPCEESAVKERRRAAPDRRLWRAAGLTAAVGVLGLGLVTGIMLTNARDRAKPTKYVTNSIGMKLAYIPAGEFLMGSPALEPGRDGRDEEGPQHKVRISQPFYMGVCEVTQREYQRVMRENPSAFKDPDNPVVSLFRCQFMWVTKGAA